MGLKTRWAYQLLLKLQRDMPGSIAHTCNPTYLGDRGGRIQFQPSLGNIAKSRTCILR
jgi:hypothetical protein